MTLKTIADAVADEVGGEKPVTISGNTSPAAQQMLRLINKVGFRLMKLYPWQALRKERTFTTIAGEEQPATLSADFNRFVPETFWNRSTPRLISGPISAVEWQGLKNYPYNYENPKFIIRGGMILMLPEQDVGSEMAYEYISGNWGAATESGEVSQRGLRRDSDVSLIDDELIIHFVKYEYYMDEGMLNHAAFSGRQAQDYFDMLVENDEPSENIITAGDIFARHTRHFTGVPKASHSYLDGAF